MGKGRPPAAKTPVKVPANSGYYGLPEKEEREPNQYNNEFSVGPQTNLSKIKLRSFYIKTPKDLAKRGYENVHLLSFKERKPYKNGEPRLVYEISQANDEEGKPLYYLKTGLYIGYLNLGGIKLEINTGYDEWLLRRMLNVANNIYLNNSSENMKETKTDNMLSNIIGFLFLTSFKAAFAMGIPSEYKTVNERGFDFKGRIDVKKYTQKDMFLGDMLSYSYKQREYVQDIIDVLYLAMRSLEYSKEFNITADYAKYYRQLKQMYSGKRVSRETIRKIENHRSLNNPMYGRYKKALLYARFVLELKDIIHEDDSDKSGLSGFLLDVSQLWEIYLENLLKDRFEPYNYVIRSQEELHLYQDAFYSRYNYPDLIIETQDGTAVAVIDAKFKMMKYRKEDVDRNDLFQIHAYAGYYNEKYRSENKDSLRFCSLVYPAKEKPNEDQETGTELYGLSNIKTRFSVGYLEIGKSFEDLIEKEQEFLDRIGKLLEVSDEEQRK